MAFVFSPNPTGDDDRIQVVRCIPDASKHFAPAPKPERNVEDGAQGSVQRHAAQRRWRYVPRNNVEDRRAV